MNNFISLQHFSAQEIKRLIALAVEIKKKPLKFKDSLKGKYVGLVFEKPSLRTKTAFYVGALQLGSGAVYYTPEEIKIGKRERISDAARTLSSYLDLVILRTFSHQTILEFAKFSQVAVVNGLSDSFHPSQVLADMLTISELKGDIKKLKVAYIGDGNNVCNSLLYCFSILGGNLSLAIPKGYLPAKSVLENIKIYSRVSGAKINFVSSVKKVASGADVLYTDAWTSMGREGEKALRKKVFKSFQINDRILAEAKSKCIVMHCLPAHRGQEITDSVIDGKNSVVFLQAENRLHAAKAILVYLLGPKK
jgi:ornithine carbamoyltransferase